MTKGSFEDGYQDGWATIAGDAPMPEKPTRPSPFEQTATTEFQLGFEYGRADALERFNPSKQSR